MNIKLALIIVFYSKNLIAHKQNSIWWFGDSAGIDFSNVNNPIPINTSMDGRGSCVSITTEKENLNCKFVRD